MAMVRSSGIRAESEEDSISSENSDEYDEVEDNEEEIRYEQPQHKDGTIVKVSKQNQAAVPAVMELDHEFMTYLFNIFSPLMCFSYTDAVDDLHYIASNKHNNKKKSASKNEKRRKEESPPTKDSNNIPPRKAKGSTSSLNDHKVETESSKQRKSKSEKKKAFDEYLPCESSQESKNVPLDPVSLREIELEKYAKEAYQKGLLYFGYRSDRKHPMNWELQKTSSGVNVYTCQYEPDDHQHIVKSFYTVPFSTDVVLQSLIDEDFLMDLDTSLESYQILQANVPNMICRRYAYKSYWPISPRDFVVLTCWSQLSDGSTMLTTVSVPNDWCPATNSHVRAYITFSGSLLRPLDDHTTEVTMMNHSKLETSIPVSIINSTAVGIPITFVAHFRKFLKNKESALKARIKI